MDQRESDGSGSNRRIDGSASKKKKERWITEQSIDQGGFEGAMIIEGAVDDGSNSS